MDGALSCPYQALLVVSFGAPERPDEVMPFLEHVVRGRDVPRRRLLEVAEHYRALGGRSPLNEHNRRLARLIQQELDAAGLDLSVHLGQRHWRPFLRDALQQMADAGVRRALAWITSPYGSYSSCRQYLEAIEAARRAVGPAAPVVEKLRAFFNHPEFIEPAAEAVAAAFGRIEPARRQRAVLLFTAHSIPVAMARAGPYERQLQETCRLVAARVGPAPWRLAYQSRSGPPHQPWLGPELDQTLRQLAAEGVRDVVAAPIGFLTDHVEVLYDLDVEAKALCRRLGLRMVRAATVGPHPRLARMVRQLVEERLGASPPRWLGQLGPAPDVCPETCCRVARPAGSGPRGG